MKKLTENTINITKKVLNERSSKKPEQLDELLGGLKRMFGKPGSPEDQEVLDKVAKLGRMLGGYPDLEDQFNILNDPVLIKKGMKDPKMFSQAGKVAAAEDARKHKVGMNPKHTQWLQKQVNELERAQMAAQGKAFKGTAGLFIRMLEAYISEIGGREKGRQRDNYDSAKRTVDRQANAARGYDKAARARARPGYGG